MRSLGAVDDEKGVTWELVYYGSHVLVKPRRNFAAGWILGFRSRCRFVDLAAQRCGRCQR